MWHDFPFLFPTFPLFHWYYPFVHLVSSVVLRSLALAFTHLLFLFLFPFFTLSLVYLFLFADFLHRFNLDEIQMCTSKPQSLQGYRLAFSTIDLSSPWVSDSKCSSIISGHHCVPLHFLLLRYFVQLPFPLYLKCCICHFSPSFLCYCEL